MLPEQQDVFSPVSKAPFIDLEGEGEAHKGVAVVQWVEGRESRRLRQTERVVKICRAWPLVCSALTIFFSTVAHRLLF